MKLPYRSLLIPRLGWFGIYSGAMWWATIVGDNCCTRFCSYYQDEQISPSCLKLWPLQMNCGNERKNVCICLLQSMAGREII